MKPKFLIASLLLASCAAGDDIETISPSYINPTYDGSTIKAELAINVPVGSNIKPATRMSAEVVQDKSVIAEQRFRGIQDIVLIPFKANALSGEPARATGSSTFAAAPMSLSAFSSSNIENWYIDNTDQQLLGSSQVYSDVTIPVDTKHFLIYGRAMEGGTGEGRYFTNGTLQSGDGTSSFHNYLLSQTDNMSNAVFSLRNIKAIDYYSGDSPTGELAEAQAYLLTILNSLLEVSVEAHNTGMEWPAMRWSEMHGEKIAGITGDANLSNVYGLYTSFILDGKSALQNATAGSASAIRLRLEALYRSALSYTRHLEEDGTYKTYKRINGTQPAGATLEPVLSSSMSYAIMDAITAQISPTGLAGLRLFQFSSDGVTENFSWSVETTSKTWLTDFPSYFHLPDGTYQITYNQENNKKFTFSNFSIGATTPGNAQMLLDPRQISYPAELIYLGNSGLRERQGIDDTWRWPTTLEAWNNADGVLSEGVQKNYWPNTGDGNTGWYDDRPVNTATTAIALKDQIQYAVASLKTRVKCSASSLADNRAEYDPIAGNQQVPIPASGLRITGVLVGNQPDAVDWQLMPRKVGSSFVDADFSRIVYDRDVPVDFYAPVTSSIETCVPNFTLLLDNSNASSGTLEKAVKVNVALEFENNTGVGFYGVHGGFIPVGGKFYVIGKMDISRGTGVTLNGTDHVFQQDFMTEANFTVTALKYAYNVIPDLRSAKLEFGLSVDIDWKSGAVFDINVGGLE